MTCTPFDKWPLILAVSLLANSCSGQTAQGEGKPNRPEVVLCASSGMNIELHMFFDTAGSNLLGEKPKELVTLSAPSQEFNPWTYFSHGDFKVVLEENGKEVTESSDYGQYRYEIFATSDGERRFVVFERHGAGEKAFGMDSGIVWRTDGKQQESIGEYSYQDVIPVTFPMLEVEEISFSGTVSDVVLNPNLADVLYVIRAERYTQTGSMPYSVSEKRNMLYKNLLPTPRLFYGVRRYDDKDPCRGARSRP